MMAEYDLGGGITVEHPEKLFARGSILRGQFTDLKSPITYGYDGKDLPIYFNQDPVLMPAAGGGGFGRGGGGGRGAALAEEGVGMNITPNSSMLNIQPLDPDSAPAAAAAEATGGRGGRGRGGRGGAAGAPAGGPVTVTAGAGGGAGGGGGRGGRGGRGVPEERARVVMTFPSDPAKMLLSGTLAGGEALANRALAVDVPLGKGHIVLFALRPFWRWQSQGSYFLAFNAINNWDHLDAGKAAPGQGGTATPGN
jgi:hypothetical protein